MNTTSLSGLLICSFLIVSCQPTSNLLEHESAEVGQSSEQLQVYFDRFVTEGNNRGFDIPENLNGITGTITDISQGNVVGLCFYDSRYPNSIEIDQDFWSQAGNLEKEMVVFHELGHCYLNRDHKEGDNDEGICLSIMASGTGSCRDAYNQQNRSYYLDELFDPSINDDPI